MKSTSYRSIFFLLIICCCVDPLHSGRRNEKNSNINDALDMVKVAGQAYKLLNRMKTLVEKVQELNTTALFKNVNLNHTIYQFLTKKLGFNGSTKCYQDLLYTLSSLRTSPMGWAGKMVDSFGKPDSGLFQGNLKWIGNYDECVNVYAPKSKTNPLSGDFKGKYCKFEVTTALLTRTLVPFMIGTCLPDTCNPSDFHIEQLTREGFYASFLGHGPIFSNVSLTCLPITRSFPPAAIGVLSLLSIFVLLAVLGSSISAYEYFINSSSSVNLEINDDAYIQSPTNGDVKEATGKHSEPSVSEEDRKKLTDKVRQIKSFLNCFCVFTNGQKLLSTAVTGKLGCLHGIRFLSMSWIILGHAFAYYIYSLKNMPEALALLDNVLFQIVLKAFYAVDTFFLLGGFLLAYLYFENASKLEGKAQWLYFYVHRYIRLTHVYMLVLGLVACVHQQMEYGPFWNAEDIDSNCRSYWWRNLLYINNLFSSKNYCMTWSWYLSNDMQFYVISPLFLVTLRKWPFVGYAVSAGFFVIAFAANFGITYYYNLIAEIINTDNFSNNFLEFSIGWEESFDKLYTKPYTRIGPYLVGIGLAYCLYRQKQSKSYRDKVKVLLVGWLFSSAVTLTFLFGFYRQDLSNLIAACFYNALTHTCFVFGPAWVIYACVTGQGGPVNKFLCFKLWIPLSRITYCAYLVHPLIVSSFYQNRRDLFYYSHFTIIVNYTGCLVLSYMAAFATSLLFESPIIRLEKFARNKFS